MYLEAFIRNLLLNENNELKNRYLHIDNLFEAKNVAIDSKNKAIDDKNIAIETRIAGIKFNVQTKNSIVKLYTKVGFTDIFGRSDVSDICGISYSAAGNLISKMREHKLIEEVKGYGKGKYRFMALIDNAEKK